MNPRMKKLRLWSRAPLLRIKKNTVVVTNDRDIRIAVGALGAKTMDVQSFLGKARPQPVKKNLAKSSADREGSLKVSTSLEFKITSEMEQIWLKSKKS